MTKEIDETKVDEEVKVDDIEAETNETYSKEELDKQVQAESDRRVSKALETAKAKWETEYAEKLEAEKSQAEELASMSAEERARAEFETEKNSWLEEKVQFEKERMELEATKLMSSEGLPVSFVNYVTGETAEEVSDNIKVFKEQWSKALDEAVTEKLKGKSPASSSLQSKDIVNMTKEEYGKLPYKERARMLEVDPEIISKLKN